MIQPDATPQGISPGPESAVGLPETGKSEAGTSSAYPNDRRKRNIPIATDRRRAQNAAEKRKNSERRRLIDPTTCERDYNDDETAFMKAMDRYKRENRRPFPTWSEVLEVLHSLGYSRVAETTALPGGKREPIPTPAPVSLASLEPTQASGVISQAGDSVKSEGITDGLLNNRRKRNIPVASDHRMAKKGSDDETEFMGAMDRYKRQNRRPFPTWSEVLEVLRSLGFRRVTEEVTIPPINAATDVATPAPVGTPAPLPQPAT
jgi:hypothetical protein